MTTSPTRFFASDNASGVHPEVMAAIERANTGHALAYGHDSWTEAAESAFRHHFGPDTDVYMVFGGTGANVVALAPLVSSFQSILCADSSHLWRDECAAPEHFLGAKLVPVPSHDGKIAVDGLRRIRPIPAAHHAQPRVLSIAQPTELGTVYTLAELSALTEYARERGWLVHIDGARLANAAVSLGLPLGAFGPEAGVAALSFGGTKNGLLGAEAVLFFHPATRSSAPYYRKQAAQLASKMRFLAAQFTALLGDALWQRTAAHANRMAQKLADAIAPLDGVDIAHPVETNAVFVHMPEDVASAVQQEMYFHVWDPEGTLVRLMTSWDTQPQDVERFARALESALARATR
ncbi:MAG: beta-eliminating lyase-related protein [Proteobacteria bacterium]|nr:beta-eliminating lyase-related protein [Pseudomonadota bacterium]